MKPDKAVLKSAQSPLHEHLDGVMRPQTMSSWPTTAKYLTPTRDPQALAQWFLKVRTGKPCEIPGRFRAYHRSKCRRARHWNASV